jgi:hypothetical protein
MTMFVYDTYEEGKSYGHDRFEFTPALAALWLEMFPDDDHGDRMPPGMITLVQQNAYKNVIAPRPPGHVQGGQSFQLHRLPTLGTAITTEVSCLSKQILKKRRWVKMKFLSCDEQGRPLFVGINTVLVPR